MDLRRFISRGDYYLSAERWYEFDVDPDLALDPVQSAFDGKVLYVQGVLIGFSGADGDWIGGQICILWDQDGNIRINTCDENDSLAYDDCLIEFADFLLALPNLNHHFTPRDCKALLDQLKYCDYSASKPPIVLSTVKEID